MDLELLVGTFFWFFIVPIVIIVTGACRQAKQKKLAEQAALSAKLSSDKRWFKASWEL